MDNRIDASKLQWKEIRTRHIVQNRWIDFRESEFMFPDGTTFAPYYSYTRRDYALTVATDEEGRFICVRQFRQGISKVTTEFPAGGIETGGGDEYRKPDLRQALEAARRELEEETGYTADLGSWQHLITVPSCATISDNSAWVFAARNCRPRGQIKPDDTEFLATELHTREEMEELIRNGDFEQSVHVMAYLLALRQTD